MSDTTKRYESPRHYIEELRRWGRLELAEEVARQYRMPLATILGPERTKTVAAARHALARALYDVGLSYPEVGKLLGGRDHTTVMASVKKLPALQTTLEFLVKERADMANEVVRLIRESPTGTTLHPESPIVLLVKRFDALSDAIASMKGGSKK